MKQAQLDDLRERTPGWTAPEHYVYARGEWHKCPMNCGGMCTWRPAPKLAVVR